MSNDSNTYNLKRDAFGLKINFKSKDFEEGKSSFKADPSSMKNFDYKNPKTITLGNISEKSSHIIHTEKTKTISVLMKHNEGGWPESVKDYTEQRDVINWKRGKEKPDEFPMKVKTLIPNATGILNQNLRMDIYEDCLEDNSQALVEDNFSARIITVFKDVSPFPRKVTKVAWHAEEQNIIGCAYKLQGNHDITDKTVIPVILFNLIILVLDLGYQ